MIAWLRDRLRKSKFVRDTLFLQSSMAIDLITGLVMLVALARGLGKDGYGSWAQVVRIQEFLCLFLSVGIVQATLTRLPAAVTSRDEDRVLDILAFFTKASILITGWAAIAAALAAPLAARFVFGIRAEDAMWIGSLAAAMVLTLPAGIPSRLVTTALSGSRRMEELAYYENYASLVRAALTFVGLTFAVMAPEDAHRPLVYVVAARLIASAVNSVLAVQLYRRWQRRYALKGRQDVFLPELRAVMARVPGAPLRRDLPFSLWIGLDKNLATLVSLVPFMVLGWTVSSEKQKAATGMFHMALRLLEFPMKALGAVARNTLIKLGEMRGARDHDGFFRVLRHVTIASGLYGICTVVPFVLLAPWIVVLLPGRDYSGAVDYMRVLAIYTVVQGFGTGLGSVFNVYERIGASITIKIIGVLLALPLGIYLSLSVDDTVMAVCWFHVAMMGSIISMAFFYVYTRLKPVDPFRDSPAPDPASSTTAAR